METAVTDDYLANQYRINRRDELQAMCEAQWSLYERHDRLATEALQKAGRYACELDRLDEEDAVCVMDHSRCTEESCEFYQSGCVHQEQEEER